MRRSLVAAALVVVLSGGPVLGPPARAQVVKAEQVLRDLGKIEVPKLDSAMRNDVAAVKRYIEARKAAEARRSDLIGLLLQVDPANAKLLELLPERVSALVAASPAGAAVAKAELQKLAEATKGGRLEVEAVYWLTVLNLRSQRGDVGAMLGELERFTKLAPKDERGAILIDSVANQVGDDKTQTELHKRIVKEYPESRVAKMVGGELRRREALGKPFELEFNDAISGAFVSMKGLAGKVVVIDFWATWCGPCVSEMPSMKRLYAEYKSKGVEFIGVSLDEPKENGGLERLRGFAAKNGITWPQYYLGKGWESDFPSRWGVNAIPAVFVVDAEGKLRSVDARGKLEELVPEFLEKARRSGR